MRLLNTKFKRRTWIVLGTIVLLAFIVILQPPGNFPTERFNIHVERGTGMSAVASELYDKNVIFSKTIFKISVVIASLGQGIKAGDYRFNYPENVLTIARRMANGDQRQEKISITIPEGTNVYDIGYILLKNFRDFNAPRFVSLARRQEGYLFPDTYYFFENVSPEEVIRTMRQNFDKKIATVSDEVKKSGKTLDDVIIMASIVEKETYDNDSRKVVAGILWKRLKDGMFLQVDAPFYYITGKAGGFTLDDLKIDSPYNTYINKGLPPAPISNPGLSTILDTLGPLETPYWFYLTGRDGEMRYAATFAQHIENKNRYLR